MKRSKSMRGMVGLALAAGTVAATIVAASCIYPENPYYCKMSPSDPACPDGGAMPDAPGCSSNAQCSAPTGVCDLATGTCVECIAPDQTSACSGATPVCGTENTCRACQAHSECASDVCLPDGSCSDGSDVAYVDPGGSDNSSCTQATPCTKVSSALATARPYVKLHGTIDEQVSINDQNVTILADPGAKLTSTSNGILLQVMGTSNVTIFDLEISGGSGVGNPGISIPTGSNATLSLTRVKVADNSGDGISMSASGGKLTITRAAITGNGGAGVTASGGSITMLQSKIDGNSGGGVSITSAQFELTDNMIVKNGGATSSFGGVLLSQTNSGTRTLDFNTIAQNQATIGITPGVLCATIATPVTFTNSIVFDNGAGAQVEGTMCSWTYSDIGPMTATGTGNMNADPSFTNPTQGDFHIRAGSPCKDAADPAATLNVDIDGDTRPQGSGRDIGADEAN